METSMYEIMFKDGRIFKVFCANKKQNQDILKFLSSSQALNEVKRRGAKVVSVGIHTMPKFKKITGFNIK